MGEAVIKKDEILQKENITAIVMTMRMRSIITLTKLAVGAVMTTRMRSITIITTITDPTAVAVTIMNMIMRTITMSQWSVAW